MWCTGCRQDVPALASGDKQTLCCSRCGLPVCADPHATLDAAREADCHACRSEKSERVPFNFDNSPFRATVPPIPGAPNYDGWELDEQLQHIQRVLQSGKATRRAMQRPPRGEPARFDPPQASLPGLHAGHSKRRGKKRKASRRHKTASGAFTWFILALGTTSLVCGGVLLAWSLTTGRHELWNFGLPAAVVGQVALLIGLVLQIDRLWHDNRHAAAKLDNVDHQLHQLKATTMMLGANHGPASTTFYSHLADGAGPQILLTDLKSQLDLLATKIAQDE